MLSRATLDTGFSCKISASLSSLVIPKSKFGINLILRSTKFLQCLTVICNSLRLSPNQEIRSLWKDQSICTNIKYDVYRKTKQVLRSIKSEHENHIENFLTSQGFIITFIFKLASKGTNPFWSCVQQKLPKNIYNFTTKYLNNTLATRKNLCMVNF